MKKKQRKALLLSVLKVLVWLLVLLSSDAT